MTAHQHDDIILRPKLWFFRGHMLWAKWKKTFVIGVFSTSFWIPSPLPWLHFAFSHRSPKKEKKIDCLWGGMGGVFLPWPAPSKHGLRVQTLPVFLPQCSCTYLEERRNIVELFAAIASVRPSNEITYNISQKLAEVSSFWKKPLRFQ